VTTLTLPTTLVAGANENVNDLNSNLNAIVSWANGSVDNTNIANAGVTPDKLSTTLAQYLGITNAANTGRGKTIIAAEESRTNVAYGTLTTPDSVASIVLPTDGLIIIAYQAMMKSSVAGAGGAALFIGANQLQFQDGANRAPIAQATGTTGTTYVPLSTYPIGLAAGNATAGDHTVDVTTGQVVGNVTDIGAIAAGPVYVFGAAGTYTVSVQFKATSGSVTAKLRKLWVWSMAF
jgi:hypothetical protein